jgi:hypothetical protein
VVAFRKTLCHESKAGRSTELIFQQEAMKKYGDVEVKLQA